VDLAALDRNKVDDGGRQIVREGKHLKKSLSQLGYDDAMSLKLYIFFSFFLSLDLCFADYCLDGDSTIAISLLPFLLIMPKML
jgi:hypothetical protein